jgi:hypothetical protein
VAFPLVKGQASGYAPLLVGLALGLLVYRFRTSLIRSIERMPRGRFLVLLLVLATAARLMAVAYFPLEPMVDDAQFHRYALAMIRGEGYGAPGVRAWFPPGMSLVLTGWYLVTTASPLSGKILQVILGGVLVWQTLATARRLLPERLARVAALLVAASPTLVFYTATLGYEILLALVLLLSCRLAISIADGDRRSAAALVGIGALLGVGALVKPICLLVPVLFAMTWWLLGANLVRAIGRAALVVIVMLLVISPWTLRNYRVLHAFVPISTNGGTTLYAANNPRATGLAMQVEPVAGEIDEVSRDRLRMRTALAWIVSNPGRSLELSLTKLTYTWGTSSSIMSVVSTDRLPPNAEAVCKAVLNVAWTALFVWCAAAALYTHGWSRRGIVPATLIIAYVFGIHLFYEALSRHHVPVVPLLCIIAAAGLGVPSDGADETRGPTTNP